MPSREFEELLVQLRSSPIDAGKSLVELRQGFDAMGLAFPHRKMQHLSR